MLISKFDLYKTEWLDLVFNDRNKSYGAYELRQHYPRTMIKAMSITFLTIGGAAFILGVVVKPVVAAVIPRDRIIPVIIPRIIQPPPVTHPHVTHIRSGGSPSVHATPVILQPSIPVVAPDNHAVTTTNPITAPIDPGPVDLTGVDKQGGSGTGVAGPGTAGPGDAPADFHTLERMPEPYGGAAAWSKFLIKNIKYPEVAQSNHVQGSVWVSFIVEADGKLSNIKIMRSAGYGMDEEALRVLKLAPAWRPGIQNGHPVRVVYNIPIKFLLGDDDN